MKSLRIPKHLIPVSLISFTVLVSYGLLIPWLRLYWDDWPVIAAARLQGVGVFWDFYRTERPFSAWTYIVTIPLIGSHPLVWHIFSLSLRWLTVIGFYLALSTLWPQKKPQVLWISLLFAVYPVFTNQPVAVAFSQHWICYLLFVFSLWLMLLAERRPKWFWPLTALSVALTGLNMFTLEYFWGLELLRPFMLGFLAAGQPDSRSGRLTRVLKGWLPYLAMLVIATGWRFAAASSLSGAHEMSLLTQLQSDPLVTGILFVQMVVQDLINNLIGVWYQTIEAAQIELTNNVVVFSLLAGLIAAGIVFLLLRRQATTDEAQADEPIWVRQALLLGLAGSFFGPTPIWLIERQAVFGMHSGRFALAAMFGLSILIVGLLEWITPRRLPKLALIALLTGMGVGFQIRNSVSYYRSSLKINDFYWQLHWRAPALQPGTAILSADELFPYMGRSVTAVAVNLAYPQSHSGRKVDYWFFELYHDIGSKVVPRLARARPLTGTFRTFDFSASSNESLAVFYKPGAGRCLWVLSSADADNPDIPDLTRQALGASNLSRILPQANGGDFPNQDLFGPESERTWCWYYQKAELARQTGDWQRIVQLGAEARSKGFKAENLNEWLVFIEGYARSRKWDQAVQLSNTVYAADNILSTRLCRIWDGFIKTGPPTAVEQVNVNTLLSQMNCSKLP
jgi:hypothetical protein